MTDEDVEKIIKRNMILQMNLAGIQADFEELLQRKPLTNQQMLEIWHGVPIEEDWIDRVWNFGRAIEAAHQITGQKK